ncbi:DUF6438 domain-containing protein [Pontibacter fetidus]|uniref:DUF6438 domain-containing protein n=1 Tax=Pontibacter fetidus TaxID=2700082 RepID=A0A6B2HAA7_9BACT|nr:DUF6438 domain-containing protein [Pontibacter fetidus]NDK57220.1 hypothetical protein [Pontibacter fetidus]
MKQRILNITKQLITVTIVMAGISMVGCKNAASQTIDSQSNPAPLLLFQKTPCFGICPSYEALIYTDGNLRFIPWEHVPVTDTLTFRLSEKELTDLTKDIANLNYRTLDDLYKTNWSDMPATHLYFYEAGKEVKHIKHEEGGPEKLVNFNDKLHQLIWKYVATPAR